MVPPGFSSPEASAASIICSAMRSFTDPPGLRYSTLASTVAAMPSVTELSLTSGVLPTRSADVLCVLHRPIVSDPDRLSARPRPRPGHRATPPALPW